MLKIRLLINVVTFWLLMSGVGFADKATDAANNLAQLLNKVNTYQADFKQHTYIGEKQAVQYNYGSMAYAKPNRFRWVSYQPTHQIIIADNKQVSIYDVDLAQVTIRTLSPQQGLNPAQLLSGSITAIKNNYLIKQTSAEQFVLTPYHENSPFTEIMFNFKRNILYAMEITNNLGQRNFYQFSRIRVNQGIPDSLFKLHLPQGVDVLRQ